MRIDAVELFHLASPRDDADAENYAGAASLETILVRLRSGDGEGWGETTVERWPATSGEFGGSVFTALAQVIGPAVVGETFSTDDELDARLAVFRGNASAKGALNCAWWDLAARRQGVSLVELLGGMPRAVACAVGLGVMPTIDDLIARIGELTQQGHTAFTLHLRPGWDLGVVRAVRQIFPAIKLRVDFDGTASMDQRDLFYRLGDFDIEAIEQPLDPDDLVAHAMLQESLRLPIALDQSLSTLARAEQAVDLPACRAFTLSPDRCGGLSVARQMSALAREHGLRSSVATTARTAIGQSHATALASLADAGQTLEWTAYDANVDESLRRVFTPATKLSTGPTTRAEFDQQTIDVLRQKALTRELRA